MSKKKGENSGCKASRHKKNGAYTPASIVGASNSLKRGRTVSSSTRGVNEPRAISARVWTPERNVRRREMPPTDSSVKNRKV